MAAGAKKENFQWFKPLHDGLRKNSRMSLLIYMFEMIRRLILLFVALFMAKTPVFQIMAFMLFSCANLFYLGITRPFKLARDNKIRMMNEAFTFVVSEMMMVILAFTESADTYQKVGYIVTYTLYVTWVINALLILHELLSMLKDSLKKCFCQ